MKKNNSMQDLNYFLYAMLLVYLYLFISVLKKYYWLECKRMISKKKSLVLNIIYLIAILCLFVALLIESITLKVYLIIAWGMVISFIVLWILDIKYQSKNSAKW